jgi:hypothetical protein
MQKNISVIVVANNNPETLEKVIWSYNTQTFRNFEVILVNENSSNFVLQTSSTLEKDVFFPITTVNFTDKKSEINYINSAINLATTNYILVTKANCLARPDFIEQHIKNRVEGAFLVGTSIEISKTNVENITKELIYSSKCFESNWLKTVGLNSIWKRFKITKNGLFISFLDAITKTNSELPLENVSFWKSDFDKIGDLDNKLIYKLNAMGLISKNIKFRAILLKLTS